MSGRSLQLHPGSNPMVRRQEGGDPFLPFSRQMNRLFEISLAAPCGRASR